ncbi:MAG: amino acid ABC transporter substrate-binding protein [Gammaproteobacteria bacterium]|nr:amino acid ABC transporter substrate-binding protein [Gammaproteobacteria bacterium]
MHSFGRFIAAGAAALLLAACQPRTAGTAAAGGDIVIGATLPLSGALQSFGSFQKWGYEHAVAEINAAGGISIDGALRPVRLIIRDDKTDANVASSNVDTLVSADHAVALLGSCTPPLVIAASLAAERNATPIVSGCAPLVSFRAAKQWHWAWDLFFNDPDLAEAPFRTLADLKVVTNRRIAILHDNSADGAVVGGRLWPQLAAKYGYQVVARAEFPVDTTDFSASVQQARKSGADILMVDTVTPQMVSIRKQMAAVGYTPKVLVMEKGAEPAQFAEAVGGLADGVIVGGYWDPSFPYAGAAELGADFTAETGRSVSQHIADSYTAARVLLDAIAAAGSLDKARINAAIAATEREYPVGPVKFGENHAAALEIAELQWQNGTPRVIWPLQRKTAELLFPVPAQR